MFDLIIPITTILHVTVAITVIRTSGTIAIAAIVIAITSVIAARRIRFATTTWRHTASTTTRRTVATRGTITTGVETPGSGGRSTSPLWNVRTVLLSNKDRTYLDLQNIIATKAFVVHLVVGVISIATAFVFDKGKEATRGRTRGRNVTTDEAAVAK